MGPPGRGCGLDTAGPIDRYQRFAKDLETPAALGASEAGEALLRIAVGLVRKLALATFLAELSFVNMPSNELIGRGPASALGTVYAYGLYIYFDFSGYTDMSVGVGRLLGVAVPENFQRPFSARNIQEFWNRWHISLSRWLRDYIYIPLGGNRHGTVLTYRNLMLTMVIGGLWHGANWTFVAWGFYHGLLLVVHRIVPQPGEAFQILLDARQEDGPTDLDLAAHPPAKLQFDLHQLFERRQVARVVGGRQVLLDRLGATRLPRRFEASANGFVE